MQEDKILKELLIKGGPEKTSPAFTNKVMRSIERIKYIHEPLISSKWIRIYHITFLTLLGLLVLVSLLFKVSTLSFTINFHLPDAYNQHTDTIIIYIIAFWALLFLNKKWDNKNRRLS